MAVKRNRSAGRMLAVFEAIAKAQPLGVSALARGLDADKSAVQRDLMTLADAGWIAQVPDGTGWELTPHVLTLARPPHSSASLRVRARPVLERLRRLTGETAYLAVPDGDHFVVVDAVESPHLLRMVPPVGIVIPIARSATGRAVLAALPEANREAVLGEPIPAALAAELEQTRARGYAINDGDIVSGALAMAALVRGGDGTVIGSLVLTAPAERLPEAQRPEAGELLREAAAELEPDSR
ncbi:MAG: IclR family transcriptional regulator [Sphingomonadales bacterium]|nr:IclR family transcriptional regulator [Sphingomonadales bacterium]